ncbi:capsular biosynthesis protein CpsC [Streptococcus sp. HF-1907]|uniref:Wzz/FepE/Etk N-terminal domain-containing protein n=1 Tax=Streptococcus sp. HF-1907 TaxID=2785793 RepID=UPI00189D0A90|nr:Wzz/FepE/Etk N-terminal domain-containing protein [Streptococcus sp. HF-1907]MBF7095399.1 capsular biosynthesis protein CpsC [Streptococcus sp. HF-1907]
MNTNTNETVEIDILYLLRKLWSKKFLILFAGLLVATVSLLGTIFLITPQYTSTTRIYVVNQDNASNNITAQDLQAGSYLVNDYKEIVSSTDVLNQVIENKKLSETEKELSKKLAVTIPQDTRIISISVKDSDPKNAASLANAIREVASEKIKATTKVQDVTTLEVAKAPTTPSSPNKQRNILLGFVLGAGIAIIAVLLTEVLDDSVKRAEDVEEVLGMTLLGVVPNTDKL